jgi:hypothetical protein
MQKEFNRIPDRGLIAEYVTFRKFVSLTLALFSLPILSIAAKADEGSSQTGLKKPTSLTRIRKKEGGR